MDHPFKGYHKVEKRENFDLEVFGSVEDIPPAVWAKFFSTGETCSSQDYYKSVEQNRGVVSRYSLVIKDGEPVFAACFQIVDFDGSNIANALAPEDGPMAINGGRIANLISKYVYNKHWKLLVCGNVLNPSISGIGANSLPEELRRKYMKACIEQIKANTRSNEEIKALVAMAVIDEEIGHLLKSLRFRDIVTDPEMVVTRLAEWANFDEYLQALSSKYRVRAKKVFKKSAEIESKELSEIEIAQNINEIDHLYSNVVDNARFCLLKVDKEHFKRMKSNLGDRFKLYAYYLDGQMIGFITYLIGEEDMDVRLIGLDYTYNRSHSLYSRILYDSLSRGIELGRKRVFFGRTATEIKSTIGATPIESKAYFRTTNSFSNFALRPLRKLVKPQEWVFRSPFKTKPSGS